MSRNIEQERATDLCDQAYNAEAVRLKHDLERVRVQALPETHPDFDGTHCLDCGDQLPAARLLLGRIRCVVCQEAVETRAKGYGRGC